MMLPKSSLLPLRESNILILLLYFFREGECSDPYEGMNARSIDVRLSIVVYPRMTQQLGYNKNNLKSVNVEV
jgi:hypothetical protein